MSLICDVCSAKAGRDTTRDSFEKIRHYDVCGSCSISITELAIREIEKQKDKEKED